MKSEKVLSDYVKINNFKKKDINDFNSISTIFFENLIALSAICSKRDETFNYGKYVIDLFNQSINLYGKDKKSISNKLLYYYTYDFINDNDYFEYYKNYIKLCFRTRSGHNYWDVKGYRECVSDHVFGTVCLANIINHYYNLDIDIEKVNAMLALHETEEVIIGDITDFDSNVKIRNDYGRKYRNLVFYKLINSDYYKNLIDEFDNRDTKEAKFAYLCDKLEYLLQVKVYEENGAYDFSNMPSNVVTDSKIIKDIIGNGASSVFEVHYEYDKNKFINNEIFSEILENLKDCQILELSL